MGPQPREVYRVALPFRECKDPRPVVVIECRGDRVLVARISGAMDLRSPSDLLIESSDPDFPATGLKKTCYIAGSELPEIRLSAFGEGTRLGELRGGLATRFDKWLG